MKKEAEIWQTHRRTTKTKGKKSETENFAPEVQNVGWKIQCLTYTGIHMKVVRFK
jgi:hypothetical protein